MLDEDLPEVGPWAREKLDRLRKYLNAYMVIMRKKPWQCVYVDAFAGAGRAVVRINDDEDATEPWLLDSDEFDDQVREQLDGSPRVALKIKHPFAQYVFVEQDAKRLATLYALKEEYAGAREIKIHHGDCNDYLSQKLISNPEVKWGFGGWKAVVFLDPFGMHVPWSTIHGLGKTGGVEVFINFPVGMAIQRLLLRNAAQITPQRRAKLDAYFGDPGWYDRVYVEEKGLFGATTRKADDAAERLLIWYRKRLESVFRFVSDGLLVKNSRGGHLYYLIFAGPNEKGFQIACDVLKDDAPVRRPVPKDPQQISLAFDSASRKR